MRAQAAMFGDGDVEPSKESAVLLCWEACKLGLPLVLTHKLSLLDFETRKDAAQARRCCSGFVELTVSWGFFVTVCCSACSVAGFEA